MKIHVWNAFASNNSGSYTVVGAFEDEQTAASVAGELSQLSAAHHAWVQASSQTGTGSESRPTPLEDFAARHGLGAPRDTDSDSEGYDDTPRVWALGHQVFLHAPCALSLPNLYGAFIYKRGGYVETTVEHAHHPLVGVFELWMPNKVRGGLDIPRRTVELLEALNADDGPLVQLVPAEPHIAWRMRGANEHLGVDLTVGVVFTDLVKGFTAVDALAREHDFQVRVRLFEPWREDTDPLAFLRPSSPPLKEPRYDVVLTDAGATPLELTKLIAELRQEHESFVRVLRHPLPAVLVRLRPLRVAEAMASRLRRQGATVELRRSEP
ncbi:hypothetical protein [Corallococcus llansteffanensis]|uniref:Uncharacterized protein n=1 Tax=Corallococcus llansteffanensis TaxID=2316731 RepID=A0A3A8NAZ6_9BACT|nr:hypothetical protein [Corallococcus llansteffanensis]RKH41476.1 hypothetical protein D7V93_38705 [Corallococcus llansteffanensis]